MSRSSQQYKSAQQDNEALRLAMIRLAKKYGRYGYRMIAQLLRVEGWIVNHKKVERLWREEGLQLPNRHKKRKRLYHKDSSVIHMRFVFWDLRQDSVLLMFSFHQIALTSKQIRIELAQIFDDAVQKLLHHMPH